MNKYFVIPFANVPATPTYKVWFASWSEKRPTGVAPGQLPPFVVGATADDKLPAGATLLVEGGTKEPPPPPPPLATGVTDEYREAFRTWLSGIKG